MKRYRDLFCVVLLLFIPVTFSTSSETHGIGHICDQSSVSIERVLHLQGVSASAAMLMAKPALTNNYLLCYARPISGRSKSQIFCLLGKLDDLQSAQPQFVTLVDGMATRFEAFAVDSSRQYVVVFSMNGSPALYEVSIRDSTYVVFTLLRLVGGQGASDIAVAHSSVGNIAVGLSSGRQCQEGDSQCISPSVSLIDGKSGVITQCSTRNAPPSEFVTAWHHDGTSYLVFASLVPNSPHFYRVMLYRLHQLSNGECGLIMIQEVSFGRPICGVQSIDVIQTVNGIWTLLIVSRPCPSQLGDRSNGPQLQNIMHQIWDSVTRKFTQANGELTGTASVSKISQLSHQFFLLQRQSEPSTIHVPLLSSSGLVGTVRINNHATVSAVESANEDVYFSHVTSAGAVVIDWISCIVINQNRPANFSLSRYSGNPFFESLNVLDPLTNHTMDETANLLIPTLSQLRRTDRDSPLSSRIGLNPATLLAQSPDQVSNRSEPNATGLGLRYEDILADPTASEDPVDIETSMTPINNQKQESIPIALFTGPPEPFLLSPPSERPLQHVGAPFHSVPQQLDFQYNSAQELPPNPFHGIQWPITNGYPTSPIMPQMMQYQPIPSNPSPYFPGQFITSFGAPNHMPNGAAFAGFVALPPIAIYATVPQNAGPQSSPMLNELYPMHEPHMFRHRQEELAPRVLYQAPPQQHPAVSQPPPQQQHVMSHPQILFSNQTPIRQEEHHHQRQMLQSVPFPPQRTSHVAPSTALQWLPPTVQDPLTNITPSQQLQGQTMKESVDLTISSDFTATNATMSINSVANLVNVAQLEVSANEPVLPLQTVESLASTAVVPVAEAPSVTEISLDSLQSSNGTLSETTSVY
jgi:hypothetical protein